VMITICQPCARLRGVPMPSMLWINKCDICLERTDCWEIPSYNLKGANFAFERGLFISDTLTDSIALIKSRKAILAPRIKQLQTEVSMPMERIREHEGINKLSIYEQATTKI